MSTPTEIRKQLLANGYTPLPNLDKRCVLPDWPRVAVTDQTVDKWARMRRYAATGVRVENGLAVIDIDVNDAAMTTAISDWIVRNIPELGDAAAPWLVRVGKGHKEAWFVRTSETFSRLHTRRWVRPGDTADDGTHSVEIFGGGSPRQFGAFGAHTREDDGTVTVEYQWVEGASPADTPLSDLPVLTKAQFAAIADAAEALMRDAGWSAVARSSAGESESQRVYDLTDDMIFDLADGRSLSLPQLRQALEAEPSGLRCSASWLEGEEAKNTSRCLVSLTRAGAVAVWESAAGVTHVEASVAPKDWSSEINRVAEKLKELDLKERTTISRSDDCLTVAAKLIESHAYVPSSRFPIVDILNGGEEGGITVANFRLAMLPHVMEEVGPRGGIRKINPVDIWMSDSRRIIAAGQQMRPDRERPLFVEDGRTWVNTYRPALPEGEDGSADIGRSFLAQMLPDDRERAWFEQWLAFKHRRPWIPGPAVLMVARNFGTGRGTLARFMERLFGAQYVKRLPFHMFAGKSYQSQYNDWEADALVAVIAESSDSTANHTKWETKSNTYERLKDLVEPAPTRRMIVRKGERNYSALSFTSYIIATNHVDALPVPENDRRFAVLANGEPGSEAFWRKVNEWMDEDANIAAFAAWLETVDLDGYSPFVAPPMTKAKETMVEANRSDLERGFDIAVNGLRGDLFAAPQILNLMRQAQKMDGLDYPEKWSAVAKRLMWQRGYRVGVRDGRNWKPMIDGSRHAVYALSQKLANFWTDATPEELRHELLKSGSVTPGDTNILNTLFGRDVGRSGRGRGDKGDGQN